MKNEDFLQYVWQYQLFDKNQLFTEEGLPFSILKQGVKNSDSGPDFENARLVIDGLEWAGKIEIHIRSSDWEKHNHQADTNYDNVILHVVWESDHTVIRQDGSVIPSFAIHSRVNAETLERYRFLNDTRHTVIPCESFFSSQSTLTRTAMIEKSLASRLERKSKEVLETHKKLNNNFEEAAYSLLMQNFGFKLNAEPFLRLSQALPLKILSKHKGQLFQIEALLFGQAGFLDNATDLYAISLQKEYRYLASKYHLESNKLLRSDWKFLRTRPKNFPTVRLSQVAGILSQLSGLFGIFIENEDINVLISYLEPSPSEYWLYHYDFGKPSSKINKMGVDSLENILINTVTPLLASYYYLTDDYMYFERALKILETLKPEKNYITRIWQTLGLKCKSAFDSQALIEQYNALCSNRKCLSCVVGIEILRKHS